MLLHISSKIVQRKRFERMTKGGVWQAETKTWTSESVKDVGWICAGFRKGVYAEGNGALSEEKNRVGRLTLYKKQKIHFFVGEKKDSTYGV